MPPSFFFLKSVSEMLRLPAEFLLSSPMKESLAQAAMKDLRMLFLLHQVFTLKQLEKQRFLKQTQIYPKRLLKVVFIYFICLAWPLPSFVLDGGGYFRFFFSCSASVPGEELLCSMRSVYLDVELFVFFPWSHPFPEFCSWFSTRPDLSNTPSV